MIQTSLLPLVTFDGIDLETANECLVAWEHKMGPINRPMNGDVCHALIHGGKPVAVTVASPLIRERAGGGLHHLLRENTVELSRLCACRQGLSRVALRLWREFVFPALGSESALSYQDADLHNGLTYLDSTDGGELPIRTLAASTNEAAARDAINGSGFGLPHRLRSLPGTAHQLPLIRTQQVGILTRWAVPGRDARPLPCYRTTLGPPPRLASSGVFLLLKGALSMGVKAVIYKFDKTDKKTIRGRVKHSRTGACTCKRTERCQHGKNYGRSK